MVPGSAYTLTLMRNSTNHDIAPYIERRNFCRHMVGAHPLQCFALYCEWWRACCCRFFGGFQRLKLTMHFFPCGTLDAVQYALPSGILDTWYLSAVWYTSSVRQKYSVLESHVSARAYYGLWFNNVFIARKSSPAHHEIRFVSAISRGPWLCRE